MSTIFKTAAAAAFAAAAMVGTAHAQVLGQTDFGATNTFSNTGFGCVVPFPENPTGDGLCRIRAGETASFDFTWTGAVGQFAQVTFMYSGEAGGADTTFSVSIPTLGGSPTGNAISSDAPGPLGDSFTYHFGAFTTTSGSFSLQVANTGGANMRIDDVVVTAVPEPSAYAMAVAALAGLGFLARRRRQG